MRDAEVPDVRTGEVLDQQQTSLDKNDVILNSPQTLLQMKNRGIDTAWMYSMTQLTHLSWTNGRRFGNQSVRRPAQDRMLIS